MTSNTIAARPPNALLFYFTKLNILIDQDGHARLADFGLLTIISDSTNPTVSSYSANGGTTRWMSPELLEAHQLGAKDSRPTKESDCYALGMVIYEVLSGQVPFAPYKDFIVMRKVIEGERPERLGGVKGVWFVGELWKTLEMCWAAQPESRPSIQAVFECLEQVPGDWKPPPPQADDDVEPDEDEDHWDLTTVSNSSGMLFDSLLADRASNLPLELISIRVRPPPTVAHPRNRYPKY
jgi:serine/threonine protein kinase